MVDDERRKEEACTVIQFSIVDDDVVVKEGVLVRIRDVVRSRLKASLVSVLSVIAHPRVRSYQDTPALLYSRMPYPC